MKPSNSERSLFLVDQREVALPLRLLAVRARARRHIVPGPEVLVSQAAASLRGLPCVDRLRHAPLTSLCGPSSGAGCKPRCLQTTSRMSSQPARQQRMGRWHARGSGSGDGQAPPARNAADDAAFPNPRESIQGAEGHSGALGFSSRGLPGSGSVRYVRVACQIWSAQTLPAPPPGDSIRQSLILAHLISQKGLGNHPQQP